MTEFTKREERKGAEQGVESGGLPEVVEEAHEVLESLVERMTDSQLEDFELVGGGGRTLPSGTLCSLQDRSADFSTGSGVGQKNRIFAKLVVGLYEVG